MRLYRSINNKTLNKVLVSTIFALSQSLGLDTKVTLESFDSPKSPGYPKSQESPESSQSPESPQSPESFDKSELTDYTFFL